MSRLPRSEQARPGRIPVASNRAPLQGRGRDHEKYFHRFVLEIDDRVARFLEGGYEIVRRGKDGTAFYDEPTVDDSRRASREGAYTRPAGRALQLVLMRIPREWWEEDQQKKWAENDRIDESMRGPKKDAVDYGKVVIEDRTKG